MIIIYYNPINDQIVEYNFTLNKIKTDTIDAPFPFVFFIAALVRFKMVKIGELI